MAEALTEEEKKLVSLLRHMDIKPDVEDPDEVLKLTKALKGYKDDDKKYGGHHYPKLSLFWGEEKGEVNWDTFKYEVNALMAEGSFTNEQIMFGMRRALKGKAAEKVRHFGPGVDPEFVLDKLDSDYGSVEDSQTAMKKFYMCEQKSSESVESFATRLEELFYKAVELKAFRVTDTDILKKSFHSGLRKDLKQMSVYQFDRIVSYDDFKRELRKIESEIKTETSEDKKTCKPVVNSSTKENSEYAQILKQINERMDKLERSKTEPKEEERQIWYSRRGFGRGGRWAGGARGTGDPRGRGRGNYRPTRPYGSGTFAPTCFICKKKGHVQRNCPTITEQFVCTNCMEKGHSRKDCLN